MGRKRTRKIRKIKVSKKKQKQKQKQKSSKKRRNYSKKQRVFSGGLPTVYQGYVDNCVAHASSRCIYRLFKLLVKRKQIAKEDLNIVLSKKQNDKYGEYMKIAGISDGMVKVIRAITTLKDDEKFTIDDLNEKFNELDQLYNDKPNINTLPGLLLEDERFIKLYAGILSVRMGSGYRKNVKEVWDEHRNQMTKRNKISLLREKLTDLLSTNNYLRHPHHISNQNIFKKLYSQESEVNWNLNENIIEDDTIITLQNITDDFEMKLALYNLIKTEDEPSPDIDKTTYTEIAEIEKEQRKVYDTLLPILIYDHYIIQHDYLENRYTNEVIGKIRDTEPLYKSEYIQEIVNSDLFKKYNNITDDDDVKKKSLLTEQVDDYIKLIKNIPDAMYISIKYFIYDKENPWKWIEDYIKYKNNYGENVESTCGYRRKNSGHSGHRVAITTTKNNLTGIQKDENKDNEYSVTFKDSHNVKFGNEGYETGILNLQNIYKEDINYKARITSFRLEEKT